MNRRDHLLKAEANLSQVIAHLQAIGEYDNELADQLLAVEAAILHLQDAEPRGKDTDATYEVMVDEEMGCM